MSTVLDQPTLADRAALHDDAVAAAHFRRARTERLLRWLMPLAISLAALGVWELVDRKSVV